jgi:signal transduction histidine kinase
MKNSIRFKITLGLTVIFIISGILLNILIRQVFTANLEKNIKSSMSDLMKSSREAIVSNINAEKADLDKQALDKGIAKVISSSAIGSYYEYELRDAKGKVIDSNINTEIRDLLEKGTSSALEGRAVVNIKYTEEDAMGLLSYPIYSGNECLLILNVASSFSDIYVDNIKTIKMITLVEIAVFALIFIAAYLFANKMINPIIKLTKQVQRIEEGNYDGNIEIRSKDEIGILIKEFMQMKDKIKEQIETINSEKEKVEKLEKVRREFFNNVTHELKTPLTAISGYSQMLLENRTEDEEFKHRAEERIYLESERLHKLVLDLIDVSKGTLFLEEDKKQIDIDKLLQDICTDMKIKADKYSVSINANIAEGKVLGQQRKLQQLFINLVDNAIKYSFKGSEILVSSKADEKTYVVEIKNTGKPIDESTYTHIFEPFIKGNHNVEVGSSGLGLYICSEIVKDHEGTMTIKNGNEIIVKVEIPLIE